MREPILGKREHAHGWAYKELTWTAFLKLRVAAQKCADKYGYPVYLVGSALSKRKPRDIDISVILPLEEYERQFGKLPILQKDYAKYLGRVHQLSFDGTIDLHFCINYWLDIKVCPDIWWPEKLKMLLAEPRAI